MARILAAHLEAQPRRVAERLLAPQLRSVALRPEEQLARELGVLELVERARDEHLATLDADGGLVALCVPWEEVVAETVELIDRPSRRCPRCGARLSRRRPVCSRCRLPVPRAPRA
ncbi:MAG: hypothetical protein ACXVRJ_05960 [Gaiellaceae bacterium]